MTLLSRKADYALLIVSHLHHAPEGGNARVIAERFGLSPSFVANILKELCQEGYVKSHRGVKGGYVLQKSLADVSLAELLESIDEGFRLTRCNHDGDEAEECSLEGSCPVKSPLADVHRRIADVLRGVSLAEIVAPPVSPAPSLPVLQTCCSSTERCQQTTV